MQSERDTLHQQVRSLCGRLQDSLRADASRSQQTVTEKKSLGATERALMKNSPVRPPSKRFLTELKTLFIDPHKFNYWVESTHEFFP